MTLQDIDEVFSPDALKIVVGTWNDGWGFDPDNERDVKWSGTLEEVSDSPYYKCYIADAYIKDNSLIISLQDESEGEVVDKKRYDYFAPKVKEMLLKGYTPEQTLGCIYGLFDNYSINEATENALYDIVDPENKIEPSPGECYMEIGFDNPLEKD